MVCTDFPFQLYSQYFSISIWGFFIFQAVAKANHPAFLDPELYMRGKFSGRHFSFEFFMILSFSSIFLLSMLDLFSIMSLFSQIRKNWYDIRLKAMGAEEECFALVERSLAIAWQLECAFVLWMVFCLLLFGSDFGNSSLKRGFLYENLQQFIVM